MHVVPHQAVCPCAIHNTAIVERTLIACKISSSDSSGAVLTDRHCVSIIQVHSCHKEYDNIDEENENE